MNTKLWGRSGVLLLLLASACVAEVGETGSEPLVVDGVEISPDLTLPIEGAPQVQKSIYDTIDPDSDSEWQLVQYVDKKTTTDFSGRGQHLQYFPMINVSHPDTAERTDCANCLEYTPDFSDFSHHTIETKRTFSPDAGGNPLGVETAGGFSDWDRFILPNGWNVLSGTFYDEYACNNSSNSVNKMKINVPDLTAFCLNVITDNTNGRYDPDSRIVAQGDGDREDSVPSNRLSFDGRTDMYTFKYTGMEEDDRVKIKLKSDANMCEGAGLGGIMVSDISTCCTPSCNSQNECGGDDGCGSPCPCTKGEKHANLQPGKTYNIRNIWTRGILSGTPWGVVAVTDNRQLDIMDWTFEGSCGSKGEKCIGKFRNKRIGQCLRRQDSSVFKQMAYVGACDGKAKWVVKVNGKDTVVGNRPFSGVNKYTMRHEPSSNNFLFAKSRNVPLEVRSRSKANRAPDHWIFEEVR